MAFCRDLEEWKKITDRILFWDYTTDYHIYIAPFPNLLTIRENANYLATSGGIGIYEEGNYQFPVTGEFPELRGYLLSRLLWNPEMSREAYIDLMKEYLSGFYGPGGKYIFEYILATSSKVAEHHMGIYFCQADQNYGWLYKTAVALWTSISLLKWIPSGTLQNPLPKRPNSLLTSGLRASRTIL